MHFLYMLNMNAVSGNAESDFSHMARQSNGTCHDFDILSEDAEEAFCHLLVTSILQNSSSRPITHATSDEPSSMPYISIEDNSKLLWW